MHTMIMRNLEAALGTREEFFLVTLISDDYMIMQIL